MRRIILAFVLMLWAAHAEASLLFTPDSFTLTFTATFNDTGTDTFCWQCADGDPSNDLRAVLQVIPELSGDWTDFIPFVMGQLNLQSTVTNFLGLEAAFGIAVTLTASGSELPQSLVNPSVSTGVIPGSLFGVDVGDPIIFPLVLECCDGFVGGLEFRQAFFPSTPFLPEEIGGVNVLEMELFFPEQIEYTPVPELVPEPTSLLLLGSAFAAAVLRGRRAIRRGSSKM
jgi:hypothetical protein